MPCWANRGPLAMALPHHPWSSVALGRAGPGERCLLSLHKGALTVKPSGAMGQQQQRRLQSPAGKQALKTEGWDAIGSALPPLPGTLAAGETPRSPRLKRGGSRDSRSAAKRRTLRAKALGAPANGQRTGAERAAVGGGEGARPILPSCWGRPVQQGSRNPPVYVHTQPQGADAAL
ncbi:FUN14 domain-containing protein 2 [Platysternon megacephalum]|uniref:FUN14 domain-containing protein 2 n=1 Tax=Platysternon megacephalum TaxID=55544 RepID=A0A4D9DLZ4_9SAUR|nr:FUN14 domain-containing protein 2 [Platysternon megacephalum]